MGRKANRAMLKLAGGLRVESSRLMLPLEDVLTLATCPIPLWGNKGVI